MTLELQLIKVKGFCSDMKGSVSLSVHVVRVHRPL